MSLVVALAASSAFAATDSYTTRGDHAHVSSIVDSGDGCTYSILTIEVYQGMTMGGGTPTSSLSGYGWWDTYNSCDGTFVCSDGTFTSLALSTTSSSAHLTATVALTEWFTGDSLGSMDVDLTLTGDGTAYRGISNTSATFGGGMIRSRQVGTFYNGTASGTAHGATISSAYASWGTSTSGTVSKYTW